jgi:hypothetical protein
MKMECFRHGGIFDKAGRMPALLFHGKTDTLQASLPALKRKIKKGDAKNGFHE